MKQALLELFTHMGWDPMVGTGGGVSLTAMPPLIKTRDTLVLGEILIRFLKSVFAGSTPRNAHTFLYGEFNNCPQGCLRRRAQSSPRRGEASGRARRSSAARCTNRPSR